MSKQTRQWVVILLVGLMGLSPVIAAAGSISMDPGTMHCLEHSHDNHDCGQCDQNAVCNTVHCFAPMAIALPGALSIASLSASIQHATQSEFPASNTPPLLFRPPIA